MFNLRTMVGHWSWGLMEDEVWRKGPWTAEEDRLLMEYVRIYGEGRWNSVARLAGKHLESHSADECPSIKSIVLC